MHYLCYQKDQEEICIKSEDNFNYLLDYVHIMNEYNKYNINLVNDILRDKLMNGVSTEDRKEYANNLKPSIKLYITNRKPEKFNHSTFIEIRRCCDAFVEYKKVPNDVKHNVFKAMKWAKKTLTAFEGSGHEIHIHREYSYSSMFGCSFSKPEWSGYHCSDNYVTGAQAVISAVLEYKLGY